MGIRPIAPEGLHEFVEETLRRYARPGMKAADLGTGRGAMAERLQGLGCEVTGVDLSADNFEAKTAHRVLDLNKADFATELGAGSFDMVTAVEVIEHVENPIGFLRNVKRLLRPVGVAVLTTPNVDSLAARVKHLTTGTLRGMDEASEPTHISPIFFDLLRRQFLPQAGLKLKEHLVFPPDGFHHSRKMVAWGMKMAAYLFHDESIFGDHHLFVMSAEREEGSTRGV